MTPADIVIVDYGMANLRSVQKAFEAVGHAADLSNDPTRISEAKKVVLPGVGAFSDAIQLLRVSGLGEALIDHIRVGRPFLGICLGMQLLFTRSYEDGISDGLNLIPGEVVKFKLQSGLKIPHMGWNTVRATRPNCPLLRGLSNDPAVYFVHSYLCVPTDLSVVAGVTEHPTDFASVLWRDNVFGAQFHPEKSQAIGLKMLKNFAEI